MAGMEHPDPSRMRVSDDDRHRVSEVLRDAAGDGRLDLEELEERLEAAYAAKTRGELAPLTADLPQSHPGVQLSAPDPEGQSKSVAVLGDCRRRGRWAMSPRHSATAVMGDVLLDLREATFHAPVTVITARAFLGSVKILVNDLTCVELDGTPMLGDFEQRRDKTPAKLTSDSPVLRISGFAMLGDVTVQRLPPPGTPRRFFGRH